MKPCGAIDYVQSRKCLLHPMHDGDHEFDPLSERLLRSDADLAIVRALIQVEWYEDAEEGILCVSCKRNKKGSAVNPYLDWAGFPAGSHEPSCVLDSALTAAGYPESVRDELRARKLPR
jgi:hypothetical protein